ncbi:hypothetical protein JF095_001309 [Salmonella enterica]|nr:hypothetical protein [Salmonella enterica]
MFFDTFEDFMVFPAPAGINRKPDLFFVALLCVPRASGDKPAIQSVNPYSISVFPAPAGINRTEMFSFKRFVRVPRASGDKPLRGERQFCRHMCSPRQRG